jgi:hypothetical protein
MTVTSLLLCAWTLLTASPDDMGRTGRALTAQCTAAITSTSGPYPGSFYVFPYLVGLGLVTLVAVAASYRISHRPLGSGPEAADRYRRTGLTSVVSAYGLTVTIPLTGIALTAGAALLGHDCAPTSWRVVGVAALVIALCSIGTAVVCLVGLLAPAALAMADSTGSAGREPVRG